MGLPPRQVPPVVLSMVPPMDCGDVEPTGFFLYRGQPMGSGYALPAAFAEEHDLAFRTVALDVRDPGSCS